MSFEEIGTGAILRYAYLWACEADQGETEGRKTRPVAVGVRLSRPKGEDVILLFPITSQEPSPSRLAAEIPAIEKRRGGLATEQRLWLILDEYNQDVIGRSFHLEPESRIGQLSKAFLLPLLKGRHRAARPDEAGQSAPIRLTETPTIRHGDHGCGSERRHDGNRRPRNETDRERLPAPGQLATVTGPGRRPCR